MAATVVECIPSSNTISKQRQVNAWKKLRAVIAAKVAGGSRYHQRRRTLGMSATLCKPSRSTGPADRSSALQGFLELVEAFLRRHKFSIRRRTREGQSHPVDAEYNTEEFCKQVRLKMQERGVAVVYNADQTGVCAYYTEIIWVKCTGKGKERVASMLMAAGDGAKRENFLIFKTCSSTKPDIARENKVDG
ncbi:hypothetical protein PC119_g1452 [Phytophthora cactorum]|nr:hypothetical protein PC119_g1452 [Phytophthora cactorum]